MTKSDYRAGFTGNQLKLLAAAAMVVDHVGVLLLPQVTFLRVAGRLAFPIFAFMIAQGCRYTRSRLRYFLGIFLLGVGCQLVYAVAATADRGNILLTFSISIALTYLLQQSKKSLYRRKAAAALWVAALAAAIVAAYYVNLLVVIDYGFWGCMMPVLAGLFAQDADAPEAWKAADKNVVHVLLLGVGICLVTLTRSRGEIYQLLALPLLLCYNGSRGRLNMKNFFYIFYPLHLALLYGISCLL